MMVHYLKMTQGEKRSADRDLQIVRHLRRHFGGMDVDRIGGTEINAYIKARKADGVSNGTINRELALLSAAINMANRDLGQSLKNPVQGRKLKEPRGRVRWITRAEAEALIRAARVERRAPYLADFIQLALHTGCRKQELLGLEWRRVDLQAGLIHLEAEHTKTGRGRSVPLNAHARAAIINRASFRAQHCPGTPWVFCNETGERIGSLKRSFATACRRTGIEDFRIHDLRHTCAAWLVSAGVPLSEVRDLLGHRSVVTTERYAHLAPERVREAVSRLEGVSRSGHGAEGECVLELA